MSGIFGAVLCLWAFFLLSSAVMALVTGELRDHRPWKRRAVIAVKAEKPGMFWSFFGVHVLLTTLYAVAGGILVAVWVKG